MYICSCRYSCAFSKDKTPLKGLFKSGNIWLKRMLVSCSASLWRWRLYQQCFFQTAATSRLFCCSVCLFLHFTHGSVNVDSVLLSSCHLNTVFASLSGLCVKSVRPQSSPISTKTSPSDEQHFFMHVCTSFYVYFIQKTNTSCLNMITGRSINYFNRNIEY